MIFPVFTALLLYEMFYTSVFLSFRICSSFSAIRIFPVQISESKFILSTAFLSIKICRVLESIFSVLIQGLKHGIHVFFLCIFQAAVKIKNISAVRHAVLQQLPGLVYYSFFICKLQI